MVNDSVQIRQLHIAVEQPIGMSVLATADGRPLWVYLASIYRRQRALEKTLERLEGAGR